MFGAVMRMERKKENHGRSPTQLRKYEKQSTGLSFNNVQPRYNLDLPARPDVLTYTKENQIKISSGKGVAIIQRMRNNVVQRCDPSGHTQTDCGKSNTKEQEPTKPVQDHHFASDKSKTYTPQFEEITDKYGLDLDDDWNKKMLPHQGRHSNEYHEYVLENMKQFDAVAQGDKDTFLQLFDGLKNEISDNPDMLYKNYWKNLEG